jgi:DNA-binding FadR family transcriptional regulator
MSVERRSWSEPSHGTLHRQIARRLGMRIVSGEIEEGGALPNEGALSEELGVSRTVVREAVKVLAAKDLLEVRPKTGTKVRPRRDWNLLDPEVLEWQFSGSGMPAHVQDLLEVRLVVEPAAARMAAERAELEEVEEIERACADMESAGVDTESSIEPDLRFHLVVLGASHNVFMRPFGALIQAALRSSFRLTSEDQKAYLRSVRQHRDVLDAIRASAPAAAEAAMRRLLTSTSDDVKNALRAAGNRHLPGRLTKRPAPVKRKA